MIYNYIKYVLFYLNDVAKMQFYLRLHSTQFSLETELVEKEYPNKTIKGHLPNPTIFMPKESSRVIKYKH